MKEHIKQTNVFYMLNINAIDFFQNEKEQLKVELSIKLEDIQSEMKIFNLFFLSQHSAQHRRGKQSHKVSII